MRRTRLNINDPVAVLYKKAGSLTEGPGNGRKNPAVDKRQSLYGTGPAFLRRYALLLVFLLAALRLAAPEQRSLYIAEPMPVEPFASLMFAIAMVETAGDVNAYNPFEQAAGIFQIRPVRVADYNIRTGSNYELADMFDYEISKEVFLYYASRTGPYNFEQIAKNWNGSGPRTEIYWERVKRYLQGIDLYGYGKLI